MIKDYLTDTIMLYCEEYPVRLSNPYFLSEAIDKWFKKNEIAFSKIWTVWNAEYNALYNYDRTEQSSDTSTNINALERNTTNKSTRTASNSTVNARTEDEEHIHSKMVTGDSAMHDESKDTISGGKTTTTDSGVDTNSERGVLLDKGTNTGTNVHTAHLFGNIGTTKTQEMAIDEVNYRLGYNPYDIISKEFMKEFVVPIYC